MTDDLNLSPEAVERFARRAFTDPRRLHAIQIAVEDCGAACKQVFLAQGDYPTVRDVADGVRNELDHAATLVRALAADNAHLRAERDEQRERAEEAESEITRAQEQVSAEFEGDCWKVLRALLDRTDFDWPQYSEDGVSSDDAYQWIAEELDRLEAERDAAWQAGAEAMREAAAERLTSLAAVLRKSENSYHQSQASAMLERAGAIRALPIPSKEGGV